MHDFAGTAVSSKEFFIEKPLSTEFKLRTILGIELVKSLPKLDTFGISSIGIFKSELTWTKYPR